jgi:hypothetical protein
LDHELRNAFRREQPSSDFTMRVLERVSLEPLPRLRWWQKLATLLDPPKLRWMAIGVTASLLLAIGAMQYSRMRQVAVDDNVKFAKTADAPDGSGKDAGNPGSDRSSQNSVMKEPAPSIDRVATSSTVHRKAPARHQEERELRAEGEAAKETLMLALSIASSTLNDAQKAIHDDGPKP